MNKIDKYKLAAEIKRNDPTMTYKEAIAKAKEMISNEGIEKMEKAN
ncbi:hypothetical protein [Tissierella sp.]